jgi:hypothetical protein
MSFAKSTGEVENTTSPRLARDRACSRQLEQRAGQSPTSSTVQSQRAYFTRFHTSSAVPPTEALGLVYFSSCAVSDVISRG